MNRAQTGADRVLCDKTFGSSCKNLIGKVL